MSGQDRIWAKPWKHATHSQIGVWSATQQTSTTEYIRRDPAVLAALPEVQAMIAGAYEAAARVVETAGDPAVTEALGQQLCCSGQYCGCRGATVGEYLLHLIRALTPADAIASRDAADAAIRKREEGKP